MCDHALRWALRTRTHSPETTAVLCAVALTSTAGSAQLSVAALRELTGLDRADVLRSIRELEASGRVRVKGTAIALDGYQPAIPKSRKPRASIGNVTFRTWLERVKAAGEKPIAPDDAVFTYAEEIGLSDDMLQAHWHVFRQTYLDDRPTKQYIDWRATLRISVRSNWFRLWFIDGASGPQWTTVGQQAMASLRARKRGDPAPAHPSH